jgi:hypothetical protein
MSKIDDLTRLRHMRDAAIEAMHFVENRTREANLPGFTTAQQSDPSLPRCDPSDRFAPRVRANELAKAAKTQSTP